MTCPSETCLVTYCARPVRVRGLCMPHYQLVRRYIRAGRWDEEDLVRRGKIEPSQRAEPPFQRWLATGVILVAVALAGCATVPPPVPPVPVPPPCLCAPPPLPPPPIKKLKPPKARPTPARVSRVAPQLAVTPEATPTPSVDYAIQLEPGSYRLSNRKVGDTRGAISALDASYVLQATVGLRTLSPDQQIAADVTGNGTVSALDAAYILQRTVGLVDRFPVATMCDSDWWLVPEPAPGWTITPGHVGGGMCVRPSTAGTVSGPATIHWRGVVFGDVTENWGQL